MAKIWISRPFLALTSTDWACSGDKRSWPWPPRKVSSQSGKTPRTSLHRNGQTTPRLIPLTGPALLLPPCLGPLYWWQGARYALEWGEDPQTPLLAQGVPCTSYNGGEDPPNPPLYANCPVHPIMGVRIPQTSPLYAPGPVCPIMGIIPPNPPNTIPSRMAIFDTSVPSLRSLWTDNYENSVELL